jgi:hypothetical protein
VSVKNATWLYQDGRQVIAFTRQGQIIFNCVEVLLRE